MNIRPLNKNIVVAEKKNNNVTPSGIVLECGNGETKLGGVVAVGPDVLNVTVGDSVFLVWNKGHLLSRDGKQYVVISADDVLAIVD